MKKFSKDMLTRVVRGTSVPPALADQHIKMWHKVEQMCQSAYVTNT